ncbi:Uncharacterised protein [uncultured archaeon]|nr:Uncharacterised protein [uncultured archaeon]
MPEKDKLFSNKMKYDGFFPFEKFYQFCYGWLTDETGLFLSEKKYKEKLSGDSKNIEVEWSGIKELTDYFKFEMEVNFKVIGLTSTEITNDGKKTKTNKGSIEITVKGNLIRDYKGKFEKTAFQKFLRGVYEKSVIASRIEQMQGKIISECDEFLAQAKAYLDLEGKR